MSTGLCYDQRFCEHDTGPEHPERPDRLRAIITRLQQAHLWRELRMLSFGSALDEQIMRVHEPVYVQRLRAACEMGESMVDSPDCPLRSNTAEIAQLAAGAGIAACDAVMAGKVRNAFVAVRPPGHHALPDRAMGFCYFNNVAIAAEHLIQQHQLKRVAIVDFDVHHGNGTQDIFYARKDVLFVSLHEHPLHQYPGTGFHHEKGQGAGEGYTLNLTLMPGEGDREFRQLFHQYVIPALDQYKPEFLLLSSGFDASEHDLLGHLKVSADGFAWMTRQLKMAAERWCGGRLVSFLEGGYELRSLSECVCLHIGTLLQPEGHDEMMAMKAGMY